MVKVLSAFYVTVQDLGRFSYRNIGVPTSGVMDAYSAKLANLLLNNQEDDAVLEVTFGTCKLQFDCDCMICLTGADFTAQVDNQLISMNTATPVHKGAILSFGKRKYGVRTYLAIAGGFKTPEILGSKSMYQGITKERLVKKGTVLPTMPRQELKIASNSSVKINQEHFNSQIITCFEGPEFNLLSAKQKQQLTTTLFTISSENSRMGYRLKELVANNIPSMLTSAVLPGTVQLTPSGKLIILMRDCQATGGYPRVLQLTDEAINKLGQKTNEDQFYFSTI